jgi:CheY-like chemotaxis protein
LAGPITGIEIAEAVAAAATPDGNWSQGLVTRHTLRENLEPLRILVADDSPTNSLIISRVLGSIGHDVTAVETGRRAVESVVAEPFDIVLMDIHMPGMDGLVATEKIRRWELGRDSRIPIVALTADAMQGDRERYLAAGMDGFISKPFDADELVYLIADLVTMEREPTY